MGKLHTPKSETELAEIISSANGAFRIEGLASKPFLGNPVSAPATLSLAKFNGIEIYEPEELILEVGAATKLTVIEKQLEKKGQMLAFEPPDYGALMETDSAGSLGGIIAAGLSGPRRLKAGAARDHVLGFRGVTGRGDIIRAGARVVKNVTGYDLPKLATGSFGSLLAMTSVTVKVLPRPETEETLVLKGLDDTAAIAQLSIAMQSSAEVSGAAHVPQSMPGAGTYIRLDGIAPSVAFRRDRLVKLQQHAVEIMPEKQSRQLWRSLRDAKPLWPLRQHCLWRLSVTPMQGPAIAATLQRSISASYFFDWAGGLIWLAVSGSADGGAAQIRAALTSGHATLVRAPATIRESVDAFHPQPAALAALSQRVKQSFDPRNILNPGIMAKA